MAEKSFTYVGKLLSNLINLIPIQFEHLKTFWGFEDELNQLRESLVAIADLVEDAEQKQETVEDARRWLTNLKQVAYEADDLLSDLSYETARLQVHSIKEAKFRLQMVPKLNKVNQSLQNIQEDSISLELSSIPQNLEDMFSQNWLPTDSILHQVLGRKEDVAKVVNLLTSSCYQQLTVVPLVGKDGVGKTTLAKLVCQKLMALTRKPFDVQIWLTVSNIFSPLKIIGKILHSLNASMGKKAFVHEVCSLINKDEFIQQLKKELVSIKFLLVLDNVQIENHSWWNVLQALLSSICTNNGNAILVTTPSMQMASIMTNPHQHTFSLDSLSNEECWLIFKGMAFGNVTKLVPSNLEAIGREIAEKGEGIPLIAKLSGGIMGFNQDEEAWFNIIDCLPLTEKRSLDFSAMFEQILHYLPSYLKSCFTFCSIFQKDFLIRKVEVIWLWMAEGIVESYDMGNKCFDALLRSSLFQPVGRDDYDDTTLCKMHDLVHDILSLSKFRALSSLYATDVFHPDFVGGPDKLRTIVGAAPNMLIWEMERLRSLHLHAANMDVVPSSIKKMKSLRYLDVSVSETKNISESITKLYNLQTLNLSNSSIEKLPEFITKLFNLRTLNLSNTNINELPESISKLYSLQTFNVSNSHIKELPESITKLHNLQTLDVSNSKIQEFPESIHELFNLQTLKFLDCKELTKLPRKKINNLISLKHIAFSYEHQMPFGLAKLSGLETLSYFVVGPDWGGNIEELQFLNKLRGNLKITRLEDVGDNEEVARANLQGK